MQKDPVFTQRFAVIRDVKEAGSEMRRIWNELIYCLAHHIIGIGYGVVVGVVYKDN